jgi:hypothetical protein
MDPTAWKPIKRNNINDQMKNKMLLSLFGFTLALAQMVSAQTTAFTYQGKLTDNGNPANGNYDLRFRVYDSEMLPGNLKSSELGFPNVPVTDGLFTIKLDFGSTPFNGERRWLEIDAKASTGTSWVTLSPRTELTPTPYAIYAQKAGNVADGAVTATKIASGEVVKSLNGLKDEVTLSAGANITLTPNGHNIEISATGSSHVAGAYISVDGAANQQAFFGGDGVGNDIEMGCSNPDYNTVSFYNSGYAGWMDVHMRGLQADGKVAIGSSYAPAQLTVWGNTSSSADNTATFYNPSVGPNASHIHYGTAGDWYIRSADPSGKVIIQDTGGKVGIGTAFPTESLHNAGDYYGHGHLWLYAYEGDGNNGTAYVQARDKSGTSSIGMVLRTQKNGTIRDAITLDPDGNIGWGASILSRDQSGSIELGDSSRQGTTPYIDFHLGQFGQGSQRQHEDYNVRLINDADKHLTLDGSLDVTRDSTFDGHLQVNGGLGVNGDAVFSGAVAATLITAPLKLAIVPTSKGTRALFCEESSQIWFADYGFGRLENGEAVIQIDPLFAETVNLDKPYHVFLQINDAECDGVAVVEKTPAAFTVKERRNGRSNAEFSYRLVALRRGFEDHRLDPISVPANTAGGAR